MADLEMKQPDPELLMLSRNKEGGFNYRERRHEEWLENYTLYRDKVTINRLTQRQSVNVPLMKQMIKTLLKDIDDMPVLKFENLDDDKQKEKFMNEYWNWTAEENQMELKDLIDKKQEMLHGRTFDQWQIVDGKIQMTVESPQDILVSRHTDPTNIDTSRFLIHTHIYKPISELKANKGYDQEAIRELEEWHKSEMGLLKISDNQKMSVEKNQKMSEMGVSDVEDPVLGETIVEITLHFVKREATEDEDGKEMPEQIWLYVEADDHKILMKKPLEQVIGKTKDNFWRDHYPYVTWAGDVERDDFWSDGVADTIRTPNKTVNAWYSQLVENRTLRSFGMHYYDTTANEGNWSPNTYNPQPWGWYGIPGDPNKLMKKVDIPDLSESLDEMQFVINMVEKASGATATQQGEIQERQVTLGEVQLALGEAKERVKGMSKFYTAAWKRRGLIFLKLIEAAHDKLDAVKIHSKGRNTDAVFEKEIKPQDWMSKTGYSHKVWSQDEKNAHEEEAIQRMQLPMQLMPMNPKLQDIQKRKSLEFARLTPEEQNLVMEAEEQAIEAMQQPVEQPMAPMPQAPIEPVLPPPPPLEPVKKPKKKKKTGKKDEKTVKKLKSLKKKIKENE